MMPRTFLAAYFLCLSGANNLPANTCEQADSDAHHCLSLKAVDCTKDADTVTCIKCADTYEIKNSACTKKPTRDCDEATPGTGYCMCADILCASDAQCDQASKTCAACIEEIPKGGTYKGCQNKSVEVGDTDGNNREQRPCLQWNDAIILESSRKNKDKTGRKPAEQSAIEADFQSLEAFVKSDAHNHNYCRNIDGEQGVPICYINNQRKGENEVQIASILCDPVGVKDCAKGGEDMIEWTVHDTTKLCHCGDSKQLCNKNEGHNYCYDATCNAAKKEEAPGSATEEGMSAMKIAALVATGVVVVALIGGAVWYFTRESPRKRTRRARRARR